MGVALCWCYYLLFLLQAVLLLLPFSNTSQTHNCQIPPGSSLTAGSNSSWASPAGNFAFGFQKFVVKQGGGSGFLLAIWLDKIPEKTIIWSANGGGIVPEKSRVQLTMDGSLILKAPDQQMPAWAVGGGAACAAMRDDGNFLLQLRNNNESNEVVVWQSFGHPTDTLLAGQNMGQGTRLVSRFSAANFSFGRFQFPLQSNGNLVLYTNNYPLDATNFAYWASNTDGETGPKLVFGPSGLLYLKANNGTILTQILNNADLSGELYQRVVLEYNGVLVQYVRAKPSSKRRDFQNWTAVGHVPEDICTRITEGTGGGACGFNSYCTSTSTSSSDISTSGAQPKCKCPPGYEILDPEDELSGCKPVFAPQSCDKGGKNATDEYEMKEMESTDWPLNDYEHFKEVTKEWCKGNCLEDCFCAVAIYRDGDCWKKRMPLSNGRFDPRDGGKALNKVKKNK